MNAIVKDMKFNGISSKFMMLWSIFLEPQMHETVKIKKFKLSSPNRKVQYEVNKIQADFI